MADQWFYIVKDKPTGPVSPADLRRLALEGKIARETRVRKGAEGEWVPAERVNGLFDPPKAEWHFSRGGEKAGPIPFIVLQKLAESGKLGHDDLVWKEGMTEWKPVASVPGLHISSPPNDTKPPKPAIPIKPIVATAASLVIGVAVFSFVRGKHEASKPEIAATQPVPSQNAGSERVEAQQRAEQKRAALDSLRLAVAEVVSGDGYFRKRLAEQEAETLGKIRKLGGPNSELGRPAYQMALSARERTISGYRELARTKVDAALKPLSQDKRNSEEVGRVLASLKVLDEPYQNGFAQPTDAGRNEPTKASQAKSEGPAALLKTLLAEREKTLKDQGWNIVSSGCETQTFPGGSVKGTMEIKASKDGTTDTVSYKWEYREWHELKTLRPRRCDSQSPSSEQVVAS